MSRRTAEMLFPINLRLLASWITYARVVIWYCLLMMVVNLVSPVVGYGLLALLLAWYVYLVWNRRS